MAGIVIVVAVLAGGVYALRRDSIEKGERRGWQRAEEDFDARRREAEPRAVGAVAQTWTHRDHPQARRIAEETLRECRGFETDRLNQQLHGE